MISDECLIDAPTSIQQESPVILFFDTETTGLPLFREPSEDDRQPHIVQFAAILMDEEQNECASVNVICQPDGWGIPEESSSIHGIYHDMAVKCGIRENLICEIYKELILRADKIVAHNISFDMRIMRIALLRSGMEKQKVEELETFSQIYCTMKTSSPIVKLPPTGKMVSHGFTNYKSPKLSEAIKFFFDEDIEGAHNAFVDAKACARLYFHLVSLQEKIS